MRVIRDEEEFHLRTPRDVPKKLQLVAHVAAELSADVGLVPGGFDELQVVVAAPEMKQDKLLGSKVREKRFANMCAGCLLSERDQNLIKNFYVTSPSTSFFCVSKNVSFGYV